MFGSLQAICLSKGFHMGSFVPVCNSGWMTLWHHYSYFINEAQRDFVISHEAFSKQEKELTRNSVCVCVCVCVFCHLEVGCFVQYSNHFVPFGFYPRNWEVWLLSCYWSHFVLQKEVEKQGLLLYNGRLCPTVCNPLDCSPPDSSVHRIIQTRILEWVSISFSRKSYVSPVIKLEVCFVTTEITRSEKNLKECSNYGTISLISYASKVMLKILQARFQQYMNHELPDVQAGCRKGRGTRDQIANILWIMEKARVPEKHLFLLYWLCQSLWLCGSQ